MTGQRLRVDFAGEITELQPGQTLTIGREAELSLDDNPYLHRHFLTLQHTEGLWWVVNVGNRIGANLTDPGGLIRSQLAPGARGPLVLPETVLTFSAGPTTYELLLNTENAAFEPLPPRQVTDGTMTIGAIPLTISQKLLILALAEPVLRRAGTGTAEVPASAAAAARLGWTLTRFNRKLDNVCDKFERIGVRGMRGGPGRAASNRRAQLVEYAVTSLLVTHDDLPLLDQEAAANAAGPAADDD